MVTAVNYDRSPSLVDPSATPNTPVPPCEFTSFAEAKAAYDAWLPSCNWGKVPTLKRFWYESERHLTPGVDYISWGFREHPHWVAVNNGEIVERTEENEEKVGGAITLVETVEQPAIAPEARAALERAEKIEFESKLNAAFDQMKQPATDAEAIQQGLAAAAEVTQPGEGATVAAQPTDQTTGPTDQPTDQPTDSATTAAPAPAAVPTVRLKYTEEEYAELRRRAEEDYAIELQRKENQYAEISMARAKQEDIVKALKAEEKGQLESLRFLKSEGPKYPKNPEIKVAATNGAPSHPGEGASSSESTVATTTSDLDVDDERYQRYRELPLLPIVKDIKGLGSTKLATLVDQYGTVGALLDMMKEKGLQWYKAVGKGFGPELGTRIEDAVADALKKVE